MKNFTLKILTVTIALLFSVALNAQDEINLTDFNGTEILADTLPDLPDGAVVLLAPGNVYFSDGHEFDKSVEFKSSDESASEMPVIVCNSNFNIAENANVSSLVFKNIHLYGEEFTGDYIFNVDVSGTIGELKFDGCKIHTMRGIARLKDGVGMLNNFTVSNCVVDSLENYGLLYVDKDTWEAGDVLIENSTISHTKYFLASRSNSGSVTLESCTVSEAPDAGRQMFRWRGGDGKEDITNGLTISNCIFGPGWDMAGGGSTDVKGYEGLSNTTITITNTYATSDFGFSSDTIVGFPNVTYDGTADDLWVDRANGDFTFKDEEFAGAADAGDPRWRSGMSGGSDWNISDAAFNSLGEISETVTVNGLTIYAHSGKTVKIDENNKSLDGMDFTHRLKLGGSGDWDESGNPMGRILAFPVDGPKKITVMAMSSSGDEDRVLNITVGDKDNLLAEFPAMASSLTKGEYVYEGGANTIYMYSPSSGVNVYYIKVEDVPVPDLQEWNISSADFNSLGELSETTTVNGLTIYAHSGKTVKIDENNKSLDGMDFTHRLKLGGSGDFDESGNPLGRILSFEVDGSTKITVMAMSSSGDEDRVLNIATGNKDNLLAEFPAMASSLTKGEYWYIGDATTVYLYSPSSGVNVYYIKAEKHNTSVNTQKLSTMEIYPNPASDRVFVKVDKPTNIAVFSIAGNMVIQKTVNTSRDYINISTLPKGLYIVKAMDNGGAAKKLIVR